MRIIEGKFAGRVLPYKERKGRRVTTEKVRKAVFDVLKGFISFQDINVLDVFAGSGMYGLEAYSRGARSVIFVESNKHSISDILKNIDTLAAKDDLHIVHREWQKLDREKYESIFDLVFADPPYHTFDLGKLEDIAMVLRSGGMYVLEYSSNIALSGVPMGMKQIFVRQYGDTMIAIFQKE